MLVTVLVMKKLLNEVVDYPCVGASGLVVSIGLTTFRLSFISHHGSFASNLEQVVNILCAQVNSAFYCQWDGK